MDKGYLFPQFRPKLLEQSGTRNRVRYGALPDEASRYTVAPTNDFTVIETMGASFGALTGADFVRQVFPAGSV